MGLGTRIRQNFAQQPAATQETIQQRQHLPNSPYVLPKDAEEARRLDFQHHALYHLMKTHILAPIQQPASILDVGCGTGKWCWDVAKEYPHAQIVGIDKAEPFKTTVARPLNFRFTQCDTLQGLPFPNESFEYIHQRFLVLAIPTEQWPFLITELARVTKAGGSVELIEGGTHF